MRGKVKYVFRNVWYKVNEMFLHSHDIHAKRYTNTAAVLYNGDWVYIDENEIRDYYGRTRITRELIGELSNDLHNKYIDYEADEDDIYWLDGDLCDYL